MTYAIIGVEYNSAAPPRPPPRARAGVRRRRGAREMSKQDEQNAQQSYR